MPTLDFKFFGPFRVYQNGEEITGFQSKKVRGLLAYLAVESQRPHSRERLAGLFWPDLESSRARAYLRHALANLRQILDEGNGAPPLLTVTRSSLHFSGKEEISLDVASLAQALQAIRRDPNLEQAENLAAAERAADQYTGPFLEGFGVDDCQEFEQWLLITRQQLQDGALRLLDRLTDHAARTQGTAQAIHYARQQLVLEPWREQAHRRIMQMLAQEGRRAAALAQYGICQKILAEELAVSPSAETSALYQEICQGQSSREEAVPPLQLSPQPPSPLIHRADPTGPSAGLFPTMTRFVGREREVEEVVALAARKRLVTLHGPGGVGKTRLAVAVVERMASSFLDGAATVSLAATQNPDFLFNTIATNLQITTMGEQSVEERVIQFLGNKRMLLFLDNFEHLLPAVMKLGHLLRNCPELHLLVTSRASLHLYGEQQFQVYPLDVPEPGASLAEIEAAPSVTLFLQQVRSVQPHFRLTLDHARTVARICVALDGLPLALELAAAQFHFLSPQDVLAQLDRLLALTWQGPQNSPERHQTLPQTIDWSYRLLTPDAQRLFRWLGVFTGGFRLEAAIAVAEQVFAQLAPDPAHPAPGSISAWVLGGLRSLIDHSLVRHLPSQGSPSRYAMLETIRQAAVRLLGESGESYAVRQAHADYFRGLVTRAEKAIRHLGIHPELTLLDVEGDNLRSGLQWALDQGEEALAVGIGAGMGGVWVAREQLKEGNDWLAQLLPLVAEAPPSPEAARIYRYAGRIAELLGDYSRSEELLTHGLELARGLGDPSELAICLDYLGITFLTKGDHKQAWAIHAESLELFRRLDEAHGLAMALAHLGISPLHDGDLGLAEEIHLEALAVAHPLTDAYLNAFIEMRLGVIYTCQGRIDDARAILHQGLAHFEAVENTPTLYLKAYLLTQLSLLATAQGDHREALEHVAQALQMNLLSGYLWGQSHALGMTAHGLLAFYRFEEAQQLLCYVLSTLAQAGVEIHPNQQDFFHQTQIIIDQNLSPAAGEAARQRGQRMTMQGAAALALATIQACLAE
jgi:predicted ATPase/DNA-binding SARP family transcriptional activator